MSRRLSFASGLSALGLWAATMTAANATIFTRTFSFQYPCVGVNQMINTPIPIAGTGLVTGASLSLFANPGGVQFVTLSDANGNVLASLGQGENHSQTIFSGFATNVGGGVAITATFAEVPTAGGNAIFTVTGNCTGNAGVPPVQGTVILYFLNAP